MAERCTLEKDGFMGVFYPGTKAPEKVIITVGGSGCDEKTCIAMSGYLRRAGYNVLVLGYYLWKGLSKELSRIPVDYTEKAVRWLKEKKGFEKIAMTGASEGASYTMLSASLIPEISCVIPVVPYDYMVESKPGGSKGQTSPALFTWHGQDLPCTAITGNRGMMWLLKGARRTPGYGLSRWMRFAYDTIDKEVIPESRIRIEDMHASVLFLAVKDDDCWPSDVAVPRMAALLKEKNYPYTVKFHIYKKASHALTDGIAGASGSVRFFVRHMIPAEKKYPKHCEAARQDSFQRILKFIEAW